MKRRCLSVQTQTYSVRVNGHAAMPPLTVKQISPALFSGNGSVRRVKLLHFIPARCILLSACLSHSSHPLYSYQQHVTSFALLRGPANETASSFLPVTSLKQLQWVCTAQAAAQRLHTVSFCTSKKGARLLWFNFLCVLRQSQQFTNSLMF